MSTETNARKSHYPYEHDISRFIITQFAHKDGWVWYYDRTKSNDSPIKASPKKVFGKQISRENKNYRGYRNESNHNEIDRRIQKIESDAARPIKATILLIDEILKVIGQCSNSSEASREIHSVLSDKGVECIKTLLFLLIYRCPEGKPQKILYSSIFENEIFDFRQNFEGVMSSSDFLARCRFHATYLLAGLKPNFLKAYLSDFLLTTGLNILLIPNDFENSFILGSAGPLITGTPRNNLYTIDFPIHPRISVRVTSNPGELSYTKLKSPESVDLLNIKYFRASKFIVSSSKTIIDDLIQEN